MLGYVILYVKDVAGSIAFYEQAFGLTRRFLHDENGKAYGELDTGAARISFASLPLAADILGDSAVTFPTASKTLSFEIALVTGDVAALFSRAVEAGAQPVKPPAAKPWGHLRDSDGHLVELCSPLA